MNIYIHHLFDQLATLCQMCFIYCFLSCFFFFLKKFYGGIVPARLVGPYSPARDWTCAPFPHMASSWLTKLIIPGNFLVVQWLGDFPSGLGSKASAYNSGDPRSVPGSGRSPGEGNGNPLQYSCLENPMDGGTWWAIVHGVPKSQTWMSDFTFTFNFSG